MRFQARFGLKVRHLHLCYLFEEHYAIRAMPQVCKPNGETPKLPLTTCPRAMQVPVCQNLSIRNASSRTNVKQEHNHRQLYHTMLVFTGVPKLPSMHSVLLPSSDIPPRTSPPRGGYNPYKLSDSVLAGYRSLK